MSSLRELEHYVKKGQNAVSLFEWGPTSSTSVIILVAFIVSYEPSNSLYATFHLLV